MSDKTYADAIGIVQQFGKDKPVLEMRDTNNGQVARFTIKSANGTLLNLSLWQEYHDPRVLGAIKQGALVAVRGSYTSNESGGVKYHNISVFTIAITPAITPAAREVVNQAAPVVEALAATAPVAEAAPAAAGGSPLSF